MTGSPTASSAGTRAGSQRFRHDLSHPATLRTGIARARRCLLELQSPDGHWVGELQGDTILESEFILLMAFLGRDGDPRIIKAARYIEQQQRPEGGWSNYPGGPVDLSVSVKAYFALKLAGYSPDCPTLSRARQAIRELGGAAGCNSFSKFYLALLGQFPYDNCPAVPPELCLLPRWAFFSLYAMSSWTRTIVVPLTIFYAFKPVRHLPPEKGIAELFLEPPHTPLWPHPPTQRWLTWTNLFLFLDQTFKRLDSFGLGPIRTAALARARDWMLSHFDDSDGVGAIFPPIIYTIVSLRCLGYADESPEMRWAMQQLDDLMIQEGDTLRVQPCFSPVWDTALTLVALADGGVAGTNPAVERGVRWLLDREVRRRGDWSLVNPRLDPTGWCFEYRNGFYPDMDDTAMVLMALARSTSAGPSTNGRHGVRSVDSAAHAEPPCLPAHGPLPMRRAMQRALNWLLAMQNRDGGWAAFDRNVDRDVLTKVPFADHNAMLDPSCPDITARVLEALGHYGYTVRHPQARKAIAFIERTQDRRGCWIGRWGVNYIYGTWQVLTGLQRIGFDMQHRMVRRAVAWLNSVQQMNGGWGESCRSYDEPKLAGQGPATASQTAWALLGLLAAGEAHSESVRLGIDYLLGTQGLDGNWQEDWFTGTGFPKVFYLKYHMYRLYFPLMALARFAQALGLSVVPTGRVAHASREPDPTTNGQAERSLEAV